MHLFHHLPLILDPLHTQVESGVDKKKIIKNDLIQLDA